MLIPHRIRRTALVADPTNPDSLVGKTVELQLDSPFQTWEQFADEHPELWQDVNPGVAPPTIDHGRLATLERRRKLATLEAVVIRRDKQWRNGRLVDVPKIIRLENCELLSPRRIYRKTQSASFIPAMIADALHGLIKDWMESGYPTPEHPVELGMPQGTVYKTTFQPLYIWDVYLIIKESK